MEIIYPLFLATVAAIGFFLAHHIHSKKSVGESLVCPLDSNCHAVIHSDHSKLFRIPLEHWGMLYYLVIAIGYLVATCAPLLAQYAIMSPGLALSLVTLTTSALIVLSGLALLLSLYLVAVQAFILKEWCSWCLMSACLCVILFLVGMAFLPEASRAFLVSLVRAVL